MSWSVTMIGKPAKVAEALDAHAETLTGQSRVEYDAAAPHLRALVLENFNKSGAGQAEPFVRLEASGYGHASGDEQVSRCASVKLEIFYASLLV